MSSADSEAELKISVIRKVWLEEYFDKSHKIVMFLCTTNEH